MTAARPSPRSVTPGIETHEQTSRLPEPGVYVGLDWVRCTAPDTLRGAIERYLRANFGEECNETRGAKWFRQGLEWDPGVALSWEHRSDICQVDLRGERLRQMEGHARVALLAELRALGMKPTRIDGAMDWVGQDVKLCESALDSCQRSELCLLRRFSPNDEFTAQGFPTRRLLKLGSRDSAVCARIYDKGLEQSVGLPGYWERLEVEWKQDRAPEVAKKLCEAEHGWPEVLVSLILGAIDFREASARSELERRRRADWWARIVDGRDLVRIAPAQEDDSFEQWLGWFRQTVAPRLLHYAESSSVQLGIIAEWLTNDLLPPNNHDRYSTTSFLALYRADCGHAS